MKTVLVLCTGNSCRSIMAEALINHHLGTQGVRAYSSGVAPSGIVNPLAIQALQDAHISTDGLSSKTLDKLPIEVFDLVVTVCDHAHETCPVFGGTSQKIHCGFQDPSGGPYTGYITARDAIEATLVPLVASTLGV